VSVGSDWNSHNATQYATGEKQSIDILAICRHRKWTILFFTVAAIGLGYLYYNKAQPVYEASAQMLIIKQQSEANSPVSLLDGKIGYEDNMTTHAQVITSPRIVTAAVTKWKLYELPLFSAEKTPPDVVAAMIGETLTAGRAGGRDAPDSQVLQVTFQCTDPQAARSVLRAIVSSYEDFLGDTYQSISNDTITLITQAKDQLEHRLAAKSKEIAAFEKTIPAEVIAWKNGLTKADEELKAYYGDLKAHRAKRAEVDSLITAVDSGQKNGKSAEVLLKLVESNSSIRETQKDAVIQSAPDSLISLQIEHDALAEKFAPGHPKVMDIAKRIERYQAYIDARAVELDQINNLNRQKPDQILAQYMDFLRLELVRLDNVETKLNETIEKTKVDAKFLAGFTSDLRAKIDDQENIRRLFKEVLDKFSQIEIVKGRGGYKMSEIRPADNVKQVEPKLLKCVAAGGLAGFLLGLGLACLIDLADKSFRNADQVRAELGTPLLGHIPVIPEVKRSNRKKQAASPINETVLTLHKPRSTIAEAYRAVRTGLNFGVRGEGHKVVQVTSPDPGDGKSTFTANLAVSLAQTGKRVLLVDADFRRPRVAKIFGIESTLGLSGVIQGTADLTDAVVESGVENLSLLACGPRPINPSELLGSQQFRELVDVLRDAYDFVLIDTPPVLAVTDPCVVAPRVDGVVLLIRITKDVRPHARRSVESLQELGANILGVVVNGVGGVRPGTGHVFSSQYGHRYASESGYYDSNAYDYDAYHHYYSEEADAGREDEPEPLPVVSRKHRDD
jgi:succinoglycan biosynthesis transport protein ExoP